MAEPLLAVAAPAASAASDFDFTALQPARAVRRSQGPLGGNSLMPALTDLKATTLFMKGSSLIAQLLKLRQQLLDAELRSGDQYGYLIDQVDRIILDVRAARVDNVGLPGSNDAQVHLLPG
jgi:hypothetical protein